MNKIINYKDNSYCAPPKEYLGNTAATNSNVVRFSYKTKNYTENDNKLYNKYALVYLPEEYDENDSKEQYNILYAFITRAKEAGVDEYCLKLIVGHQIGDVTERVYTHRTVESLAAEIEKIG